MGQVSLNLDGGGFYADRSSCHGKPSKLVVWDRTLRLKAPTVHVDMAIMRDSLPGPPPHWAWILETPTTTRRLMSALSAIGERFERVFTHSTTLGRLWDGPVFWAPASGIWIHNPRVYPKSRLVSMFTSPKAALRGHQNRLRWAERLAKKVDIFGLNGRVPYKEMGLNDYMFSVAMENARSPGYFTEKILDCFATGTVPIYYGAPDIGDFFNKDGIIELTDDFDPHTLTGSRYQSMLPAVRDNFERCLQYEIPEDYIAKRYLI